MINICLKFYNVGYNHYDQVKIIILDKCNNKIFEGKTYNGLINVRLKCYQTYKIICYYCNKTICTSIYPNPNYINYFFNFNTQNNIITLLLKDKNYKNLLIEKGKLILWQK